MTGSIMCDGIEHRLTWTGDRLIAHDHDTDAERALAALGADDVPICLDLVEACSWAKDNPYLIPELRGDIPPRDLGSLRADRRDPFRAVSSPPAATVADQKAADVRRHGWYSQMISSLPRWLRPPVAASMAAALGRLREEDEERAETTLQGYLVFAADRAVRRTLDSWIVRPDVARPGYTVRLAGAADPAPVISIEFDGYAVEVVLPLRWFAEVWPRWGPLIEDCFILDTRPGPGKVLAMRWEYQRLIRTVVPVVAPAAVVEGHGEPPALRWLGDGHWPSP